MSEDQCPVPGDHEKRRDTERGQGARGTGGFRDGSRSREQQVPGCREVSQKPSLKATCYPVTVSNPIPAPSQPHPSGGSTVGDNSTRWLGSGSGPSFIEKPEILISLLLMQFLLA